MTMLADTIAALSNKIVALEDGITTVITHVRLIAGTGAPPTSDATVVIDGSRIASIGRSSSPPPSGPNVRAIDGSGLTVLPGLIDGHIHFTGDTALSAIERYSPNVWEPYRGIVAVWDVARTIEAGFTTVRCLGHGSAEQSYALRRAVAEGLIPGPRILSAGWSISQTGGHGDPHFLPQELALRYRPRSAFADGPIECRRMVRQNFGEGADCIKIYTTEGSLVGERDVTRTVPNFTLEEVKAMTDEAHSRGARVAAHATAPSGVRTAILGGVDTIEHGGPLGDSPELIDLMIERGTFLVPTLKIYEVLVTQGDRLGVRPSGIRVAADLFEKQKSFLRGALDRGLKIACGTDTALFDRGDNARELGLLVESGFSPMEAIVAATKISAEAIGLGQHIGTLEPGKVGELIAVSGDPLTDIDGIRKKDSIKWIFKSRSLLS
ncbi:MAG: amidohydrolase family protein [Candidatus Limnocylindria bacterium]